MITTYYIRQLLRQASAPYARQYLGIENANGEVLLTDFNNSEITCGYVTNNTPLWNDVRIPMTSLRSPAGAPSAATFLTSGGITIRAYQFVNAPGLPERLDFELQAPHGLNVTYGLKLHIHFAVTAATTPNSVGWKCDAAYANPGQAFSTPTTFGPGTAITTVGNQHTIASIHTFTGLSESAVIVGSIYRDTGDSYNGNDVFGLSLDAHYVVQKAGSLNEMGD